MISNLVIDNWQAGSNVATDTAHKMMNDFMLKRHEKEESEIKRQWPDKLKCCKCKQYHESETMIHIKRVSRRNCKKRTTYAHICTSCQETYKPNSKRVGGRNY
jgi:hypothetical protein